MAAAVTYSDRYDSSGNPTGGRPFNPPGTWSDTVIHTVPTTMQDDAGDFIHLIPVQCGRTITKLHFNSAAMDSGTILHKLLLGAGKDVSVGTPETIANKELANSAYQADMAAAEAKGVKLGQRLTVEGVTALRKQRDALRAQLDSARHRAGELVGINVANAQELASLRAAVERLADAMNGLQSRPRHSGACCAQDENGRLITDADGQVVIGKCSCRPDEKEWFAALADWNKIREGQP